MTKKDNKKYKLRVGYTVFTGLVIFFIFIFLVGTEGYYFSKTYRLKMLLKDSQGLIEGSKVYLGGLKVGRIDNINFTEVNNENLILVELSILEKYSADITDQSYAKVETSGLLGDKIINVSLGSPSDTPLKEGDFLPVKETFSLTSLTERIEPIVENINSITSNLKTITDTIKNGNGDLGKMLLGFETTNKLNSTLENISAFTEKINDRNSTLGQLVNNDQLYNDLSSLTTGLELIVDNIKTGKGTIGKLATNDSLFTNLNRLSYNLNKASEYLQNDSTVAGGLLKDKEVYIKLNSVLDELDELVKDFKENPNKYIDLSIF